MPISQKVMRFTKGRVIRRRSQLSRLRQTASSKDSRDLSRVVRSHRAANPYQITPSAGRTVSFWRKSELNVSLNQSTGFGGGGSNINFGFSLGYTFAYVNGSFTYAVVVPNSSDFQALFDYYKINAVKMQMFYSKTVSEQSTTVTSGMPIFLIANDFDDVQESMTLATMNERVGVRHVQFSSDQPRGITHYVKPVPSTVVVQTNVSTGAQTTANAGIPFGATWLDVAQSNILHNGVKIWYDNQGLTTATSLGTITFVFDVEYVFKGYR